MRTASKIWLLFVGLIIMYLIVLSLKINNNLPTGFIRNHFNDLLCIPIVLFIATIFLRLVFFDRNLKLSAAQIIVAVLLFSVFFEMILPYKYAIHTGDWLDVVCYSIGGLVFWRLAKYF